VIAEELDVVLDLEPPRRVTLEADAQRIGEIEAHVIRGLHLAAVADLVVEDAQVHRAERLVRRLRRAGRQGEHLQRLVDGLALRDGGDAGMPTGGLHGAELPMNWARRR
jgi:hypothetical protein